jgi:membrane protease YdiL (CAAX protease family)
MDNNKNRKIRIKPVLWFIILTFAFTYTVEFTLIANGVRFDGDAVQSSPTLWLLTTMWIPGIIGIFVTLFIEGAPLKELVPTLSLRMGSIGPYLLTILIAPLAFAAMYILTWGLGLSSFDPVLSELAKLGGVEITQKSVLEIMLPFSILLGPIINFIFGLGEEIGWRGFLLPRLMPLGKTKAYLILGIIWGLWHAPLIFAGFNYPGYPISGIAMMCILSTTFGLFLNEMTLHYRSAILAAFIHGAVNAQGYGIWMWMFPNANPMLGGGTGLTAIAIWLLTGLATMTIFTRLKQTDKS